MWFSSASFLLPLVTVLFLSLCAFSIFLSSFLCFYFLLHVNCFIRIRKVAATCPMAGVMFSEGGDTSRTRPVACRLTPRAKRPGSRADHSLPSSADVKMLGAMPPRPHSNPYLRTSQFHSFNLYLSCRVSIRKIPISKRVTSHPDLRATDTSSRRLLPPYFHIIPNSPLIFITMQIANTSFVSHFDVSEFNRPTAFAEDFRYYPHLA